jgi:hypothetical protein
MRDRVIGRDDAPVDIPMSAIRYYDEVLEWFGRYRAELDDPFLA